MSCGRERDLHAFLPPRKNRPFASAKDTQVTAHTGLGWGGVGGGGGGGGEVVGPLFWRCGTGERRWRLAGCSPLSELHPIYKGGGSLP